uniref:Putative secreted protein n=1 Tax=Anopheles darlingi TaxID=43151 RepID=A0A2M4D9J0_ANODA
MTVLVTLLHALHTTAGIEVVIVGNVVRVDQLHQILLERAASIVDTVTLRMMKACVLTLHRTCPQLSSRFAVRSGAIVTTAGRTATRRRALLSIDAVDVRRGGRTA